jgi:transposase
VGLRGKGEKAADAFVAELDPEPAVPSPPPAPASQPGEAQAPAIMVPFGLCPTVPAGHGIRAAWLTDGCELDPQLVARASRLTAISTDMTGGYAASARHRAPQAVRCIDPTTWCSSPTRRWTRSAEPTGTSCAPSATKTPPNASRTPAGHC